MTKQQKVCKQKITYPSKRKANFSAKYLFWTRGHVLESYRCPCCGKYHLTKAHGAVASV